MFRLESVSKVYGGRRALDDFSLAIEPGKTTVLIGPSGCGKSTVFGVITGLLKPDSGSLFFENRPIAPADFADIRKRIGYVIQDGGLFPHLTGAANVALMARHLGWDRTRINNRIDELSILTRLSHDILKRFPAEMSGGQRQRVSLMRALMLDADALLLDEPLGALDPMVRADLQHDLAEIFRRLKKTVVLVTHDLSEATFLADKIALMRNGTLVQLGTADDLFDRPANDFVRQFTQAQRDCSRMGVGN